MCRKHPKIKGGMMDWIETKTANPDSIGDYLIYYCESWNSEKTKRIAWAFYNSWGEWCIQNSKVDPSHWMRLPHPPEEKKEHTCHSCGKPRDYSTDKCQHCGDTTPF